MPLEKSMYNPENLGRGPEATADMKARIAVLRRQGANVVDELMERHRRAVSGEGYTYEFATELVRSSRDGSS